MCSSECIFSILAQVFIAYVWFMYIYGWRRQGVLRKDFCLLVGAPVLHLVLVTQNSFSQLETAGLGHVAKMIRAALH